MVVTGEWLASIASNINKLLERLLERLTAKSSATIIKGVFSRRQLRAMLSISKRVV